MPETYELVAPETIHTHWIGQLDAPPTLKTGMRYVKLALRHHGAWYYTFYTVVNVRESSADIMLCGYADNIILHAIGEKVRYSRQCPEWDAYQIPMTVDYPLVNTANIRYAEYNDDEEYVERQVYTA
jgi:hypothetical protein